MQMKDRSRQARSQKKTALVDQLGNKEREVRDHAKVSSFCVYVIRYMIVTRQIGTVYRKQLKTQCRGLNS